MYLPRLEPEPHQVKVDERNCGNSYPPATASVNQGRKPHMIGTVRGAGYATEIKEA